MAETVQEKLGSHRKIDRDRGIVQFVNDVQAVGIPEGQVAMIKTVLSALLVDGASASPWEPLHGGLMAGAAAVTKIAGGTGLDDDDTFKLVANTAVAALSHGESRIRIQAGETLGALCKAKGAFVFTEFAMETLIAGIRDNMERDTTEALPKTLAEQMEKKKSKFDKVKVGKTAAEIFHESAGWKSLETSSKALLEVIKGCGASFVPHITQELVTLVFDSLGHTNRFVRETAFYLFAELAGLAHEAEAGQVPVESFDAQLTDALAIGLADNWSQVRMAASVAARRFLTTMDEASQKVHFTILLPRMVLNRYYVAEGVRLYSQATWAEIGGGKGKALVEEYMGGIVDYYIESADAANHAVREAACACIAELGLKVDKDAVRPYFTRLLDTLVICFNDESWPVRDAACVASGRFIKSFPEESRPRLEEFYKLFFFHCADNIWSVRENAAIALGCMVEAYGDEAVAVIKPWLVENLPKAKVQPKGGRDSTRNTGTENVTQFGVAPAKGDGVVAASDTAGGTVTPIVAGPAPTPEMGKVAVADTIEGGVRRVTYKFGQNDPMHENKQVFSCGSLAPKLKRKGGCMDCDFTKEQEPWEATDGCVYLLRELAGISPEMVLEQLPVLAEVVRVNDFADHVHLLETVWNQLTVVADKLGKKKFKAHLQAFIPSLHYTLQCENNLARVAGENFTSRVAKLIGPTIFKSRVEQEDPRWCDAFNRVIDMPPMGGMMGGMGTMPPAGMVGAPGGVPPGLAVHMQRP